MLGFIRCSIVLLATLVVSLLSAAQADEQVRVWKDNTGSFEIKATLLKAEGDSVQLKRERDGRVLKLPLVRLSAEDQKYVQSRAVDNPFATFDEKVSSTKSLVGVRIKTESTTHMLGGVVIHCDEKVAYLACRNPRLPVEAYNSAEVSLHWRKDGKNQTVQAHFVAPYDYRIKRSYCLVAAPTDRAPPPLESKDLDLNYPLSVKTFGYQFVTKDGTRITQIVGEGQAQSITGNAGQRYLRMQTKQNTPPDSLVLLEDGTPIGCFLTASSSRGAEYVSATAFYYVDLAEALQPSVTHVHVVPVSGDRKKITYAVAAYFADPLDKLAKHSLLIRARNPRERIPSTRPTDGKWTAQKGMKKIELKTATDELPKGLPAPEKFVGVKVLVGRITLDNPGPIETHQFAIQLAHEDAKGNNVYSDPKYALYAPEKDPQRPSIPGLDMRPLDMPNPVKVEGGWRLTSDITRVPDSENAPVESAPFPAARRGSGSILASSGEQEDALAGSTKIKARNGSVGGRLAIYSPDGKWLYMVDASNILYQVDAKTMDIQASLSIRANVMDLGFSKAGLLVSATDANRVWVLNPDSLKLVREIPSQGVRLIAGTPRSDIGFIFGAGGPKSRYSSSSRGSTALCIVNFTTGKKLHWIAQSYPRVGSSRSKIKLDMPGHWPIASFWRLRMSPDGKYLYTFDLGVKRFRIDGEDLIFEEAGAELTGSNTTLRSMEISGDGKYVIALNKVYKSSDIKTAYMTLPEMGRNTAIDPSNGKYYVVNHDNMAAFSDRGELLKRVRIRHHYPGSIVVHPNGDRAVSWCLNRFSYCDFRPADERK